MKIDNNTEIQSVKNVGSLPTLENEQMFAEVVGMIRQIQQNVIRNLWRMKQFYETYAEDAEKLSALLRQISWTNNLTIMSRCKTSVERTFYLQLCVREHLSSRQLDRQIDAALYERTKVATPKLSPLLREMDQLDSNS